MGDVLGYARASTTDQDVAGQSMRLTQAGAIKVFTDVRSGRSLDRPGLDALLAYAREGDTLAVVRLDRLGRSLSELLATVEMLRARQIALRSPGGKDRHQLSRRRVGVSRVRRHCALRTATDRGANQGRNRRRTCARQATGAPAA